MNRPNTRVGRPTNKITLLYHPIIILLHLHSNTKIQRMFSWSCHKWMLVDPHLQIWNSFSHLIAWRPLYHCFSHSQIQMFISDYFTLSILSSNNTMSVAPVGFSHTSAQYYCTVVLYSSSSSSSWGVVRLALREYRTGKYMTVTLHNSSHFLLDLSCCPRLLCLSRLYIRSYIPIITYM